MESISSIILSLTFLAILWYAWETRGLKIQIIRQTELSLRPLVLIDWISPGKYVLKNIGNGPALDIQIDEISLIDELAIKYSFKRIDLLETKEQRDLEILIGGRTAIIMELGAIMPHSAGKDFDYFIKYADLNGMRYESNGKVGKVGAIFLGTRRIY